MAAHNPFRDHVTNSCHELDEQGCVRPMTGPGLGLTIDEKFLVQNPLIEGPCYV